MLKLKIEAANGAEMREQLEALLGVYGGSKELKVEVAPKEYQPNQEVTLTVVPPAKEEAPEEVKEEKPKRRKTKKEEEVAQEAEKAEEEEVEEKSTSVTKEQLIQEVVNANRAGKRAEVIALLESFGVERTTALKEDQYSDFYNKIIKL